MHRKRLRKIENLEQNATDAVVAGLVETKSADHDHSHIHDHTHESGDGNAFLSLIYRISRESADIRAAYERLLQQTCKALMRCLELRDPYTFGHSMRVMEYSLLIGRGTGLKSSDLKNLELAAMFHDIGKIGVRDCVLLKDGPLNNNEGSAIRKHPDYGAEVLELIDEFKNIVPGVRHHHERLDGKGYPNKLAGEEIPLYSRIILVADTFDAMTSTRPYRKFLPVDTAYAELERCAGSQFEPEFVEMFLREHRKLTGATKKAVEILLPRKKAA